MALPSETKPNPLELEILRVKQHIDLLAGELQLAIDRCNHIRQQISAVEASTLADEGDP